jgi:hypothetical protein
LTIPLKNTVWRATKKEAIPITVTDILKAQHKTPEEISAVESELLELAEIDCLLRHSLLARSRVCATDWYRSYRSMP